MGLEGGGGTLSKWEIRKLDIEAAEKILEERRTLGSSVLCALNPSWSQMLLCGMVAWSAGTKALCSWLSLSVLVKLKACCRAMSHSHISFLLTTILDHGDIYGTDPLTIHIPPREGITCNKH